MADTGLNGDLGVVGALLREQFDEDIEALEPLTGGVFSRAFAFNAGGRAYVVRLNAASHGRVSFEKDAYAARHFSSAQLPIPRVVAIGVHSGGWFGISERAGGRPLLASSPEERRRLLPAVLDTLAAIGAVDVSASSGFGDWGADGNGRFPSWRSFLAHAIENESDGYYRDWHRFYRDSFLERDLYEAVYERMLEFAAGCPEVRGLIHNDYHFENVLGDGERVTAVLDWANALYGDPLYDVAWLNWISIHPGWWYDDGIELLAARFGHLPDFATRTACYQCHVGLDHLRYYAKHDRLEDYELCRDWLLAIISHNP